MRAKKKKKRKWKFDVINNQTGHYTNIYCVCGCRMRANSEYVWCSGVDCNFWHRKEY